MQIVIPGHGYRLADMEGGTEQTLTFIQKTPISPGASELETIRNGTTNEEVVDMMIDRMQFLEEKLPCDANKAIITAFEEIRTLLAQRKAERTERGVLGTHNA